MPLARAVCVSFAVAVAMSMSLVDVSAAECPNEPLRYETHSTQLPDCRAYELVTPPFKEGSGVEVSSISEDGSHLLGRSVGVFASAEHENSGEIGGGIGTAYELLRGEDSWLAKPLGPPSTQFSASTLDFGSPDSARTLWRLRTPSQLEGEADLYRREPNGSFIHIGPLQPPSEPARFGEEANEVGVSQDLTHALFKKRPTWGLWPGDTTAENFSLYEYAGVEQAEPKLVGVKNDGPLNSDSEAQLVSQCGTALGSENEAYNAISADGAIVYFTALACGASPSVNELYVRIDQSQTVAISEPSLPAGQCTGACEIAEHREAIFQGASEDGSEVFFTSEQPLINGTPTEGIKLYQAQLREGRLINMINLSADATPGQAPQVQGVARIAADGSHVYFVATGLLTSVPNSRGEKAEEAADNLYVVGVVGGRTLTSFIARLSSEDGEIWQQTDSGRPVASTPDGRFLVLVSHADLTHEGTSGQQVYEYGAQSGELKRVSLGQHSALAPRILSPSYAGGDRPAEAHSHLTLSDDGSYVFFESADGLTPQALDDQVVGCFLEFEGTCFSTAYAKNIYEYHDRLVRLIVSVRPPSEEPALRGTDSSGSDVFFTTADPLVAKDTDTQQDIYDARIDGGFAVPALVPGCSGDACHGSLSATPLSSTIGSTTQPGTDNLAPPVPKLATRPKAMTRAQKLSKALKACKKKSKQRRAACESQARRTYGSKSKAKKRSGRAKR